MINGPHITSHPLMLESPSPWALIVVSVIGGVSGSGARGASVGVCMRGVAAGPVSGASSALDAARETFFFATFFLVTFFLTAFFLVFLRVVAPASAGVPLWSSSAMDAESP